MGLYQTNKQKPSTAKETINKNENLQIVKIHVNLICDKD